MDKLAWYVVRSSGIIAWAFAAASVLWGLLLSTRLLGRKPTGPWLLDLHRFLGTLTLAFVAVHLVGLWFDTWTYWAWAELFVPFASDWRPGATAWGILAMYLLAVVQVSSRFMHRIPRRWWKGIHWSSLVVYLAATLHLLEAGTDAANPLLRAVVAATSLAVLVLLAIRPVLVRRRRRPEPARRDPIPVEVP